MDLRMPGGSSDAPWAIPSNMEAARLRWSSIEWAVAVREAKVLGSGVWVVSAAPWPSPPLLLQGAEAALAA